jgi:Fe2+ transport system protein B
MAVNLDSLKTQYLQHDVSTQLGRLVENLTQIKALAQAGTEEQIAQDLIRESQFFIEWVIPNLNLETTLELATELVELQRQLSRWKLHWSILWLNPIDRLQVAADIQEWRDRLQLGFASLNDL